MDMKERYKLEYSIKDAINILDSAPIHRDLIAERMIVELTNRAPIAHLAIERGLKALISEAGGEQEHVHALNRLYQELSRCNSDAATFMANAFEDAVKFYGYNVNAKGFGHFRSLNDYFVKTGTENAFKAMRYWVLGESHKGENPIPYILMPIHRELLYAVWRLFTPNRRETVSIRVEHKITYAMFEGRHISYGSDYEKEKSSVLWYANWLFKEHTSCCKALEDAVALDFHISDEEFINKTVRAAYDNLEQSMDPAVRYYISMLKYLPEGSQQRPPDVSPDIEWFNQDRTAGMVVTPAYGDLGLVEKYADGGWGIIPSEDGFVRVTEVARTLRDAKWYLVNRLTHLVTVTVNEESRQLRMLGEKDFSSKIVFNAASDIESFSSTGPDKYELEFWDTNHGLNPGETVRFEYETNENHGLISVLEGMIIVASAQKVSIKGRYFIDIKRDY